MSESYKWYFKDYEEYQAEYDWYKTRDFESEQDIKDAIWRLDSISTDISSELLDNGDAYSKSEKEELRKIRDYIDSVIFQLCNRRRKLFGNK